MDEKIKRPQKEQENAKPSDEGRVSNYALNTRTAQTGRKTNAADEGKGIYVILIFIRRLVHFDTINREGQNEDNDDSKRQVYISHRKEATRAARSEDDAHLCFEYRIPNKVVARHAYSMTHNYL